MNAVFFLLAKPYQKKKNIFLHSEESLQHQKIDIIEDSRSPTMKKNTIQQQKIDNIEDCRSPTQKNNTSLIKFGLKKNESKVNSIIEHNAAIRLNGFDRGFNFKNYFKEGNLKRVITNYDKKRKKKNNGCPKSSKIKNANILTEHLKSIIENDYFLNNYTFFKGEMKFRMLKQAGDHFKKPEKKKKNFADLVFDFMESRVYRVQKNKKSYK